MLCFTVFADFYLRPPILFASGKSSATTEPASPHSPPTPLCPPASNTLTPSHDTLPRSPHFKPFPCHTYETPLGGLRILLTKSFCIAATVWSLLILSSGAASGHSLSPRTESAPSRLTKLPAPSGQSSTSPATSPTESIDAPLAQAHVLLEKGSINEADRVVRQYLQTHPDSADGHFLLGHILFREIQSEAKLETQLEGIQVLGAGVPRAKHGEEKARASLAEFTVGAKFHDPSAADLKVVALEYVLLGDYVDADKWLTKMLAWTPNDADGWYLLGRTKYNENRFAEAVDAFQRCLKLDPRNVKAEDNLGLSYAGLGRREEAASAYQQVIDWQSRAALKNPGPYIDFGDLLLDENRNEEAVSYLLQAVAIAPRECRAHELLGKAYTRLDQFSKAQAELEKALQLSPQSANLHCMLAPVYRKQGIIDKAKLEYERCSALAGSHSVPQTPRP
jgi:Flp pilus assembly protein TadD